MGRSGLDTAQGDRGFADRSTGRAGRSWSGVRACACRWHVSFQRRRASFLCALVWSSTRRLLDHTLVQPVSHPPPCGGVLTRCRMVRSLVFLRVPQGVDPSYREYLAVLQEKNRILKELRKKEEDRVAALTERERNFDLNFKGANEDRIKRKQEQEQTKRAPRAGSAGARNRSACPAPRSRSTWYLVHDSPETNAREWLLT